MKGPSSLPFLPRYVHEPSSAASASNAWARAYTPNSTPLLKGYRTKYLQVIETVEGTTEGNMAMNGGICKQTKENCARHCTQCNGMHVSIFFLQHASAASLILCAVIHASLGRPH